MINQYDYRWLFQHRLSTPCSLFFDDSPYKMINELYPDQFKEWEFKKTPVNFWTKKKRIRSLEMDHRKKRKINRR